MQIKSIAIATPTHCKVGDKQLTTGLFKHAIDGPVQVTPQGLTNDAIINKAVHGGLDQAIYLYRSEDYDWWSEQLGTTPLSSKNLSTLSGPAPMPE